MKKLGKLKLNQASILDDKEMKNVIGGNTYIPGYSGFIVICPGGGLIQVPDCRMNTALMVCGLDPNYEPGNDQGVQCIHIPAGN